MQKHPESYKKYLERKPPESYIKMINEVAPSCYSDYELLCGFSHGGVESWLFKIKHVKTDEGGNESDPDMGVLFHEKESTIIINHVLPYFYAYVKFIFIIFPEVESKMKLNAELLRKYNQFVSKCESWFRSMKEKYPDKTWADNVRQLVE